MLKRMSQLKDHYIVCGIGRVGGNVAHELTLTGREYVVIDTSQAHIDAYRERVPDTPFLHGDASEDDLLRQAGVESAAGVFAVTGDDSKNLVITLSARQLNPALRIVARCHEVNYIDKIRKVGADSIVSPDFTGGMRIASAMIRPQVVNLLDEMRRRTETRFIAITHNPVTMSRMDRLFGVTMAERGVSQLVSVDLEAAVRFREAG